MFEEILITSKCAALLDAAWDIFIVQARVNSIIYFALLIVYAINAAVIFKVLRSHKFVAGRHIETDLAMISWISFTLIASAALVVYFGIAITGLVNPEYLAIDKMAKLLQCTK